MRPELPAVLPALAMAAALILTGCGAGPATDAEVGAVSGDNAVRVGQCYLISTPEEYGASSHTGPAVACSEPHTTQTFLVAAVPQPLSGQAERPLHEQLQNLTARLCPATELRRYLGGAERDATTGMAITGYYPTRAAWSAGSRTVRCDVLTTTADLAPRETKADLKDALARPESAPIRLCYTQEITDGVLGSEGTDTPCSEPHTTEDVSAWFGQDASLVPLAAQQERCLPFVLDFLNVDVLPADVEVRPIVRVDGGARAVRCGVAPRQSAGPERWTGTLAPVAGTVSGEVANG
ncbi:septum formation family protein [Paenarthrobacter sp. AR 02]|uniref:septum formation family protein n=1 Tax=Paenarthrobacter sp. AR 02 TaxID=2899821 RepID=UPI001F3938AC|nr:septum formation family protein [Paenarthrobacter sp. AR 02]MCF3138992.1 septum formation family protein [Paenarthrobacter sp. AR 02]